MTDPNATLVTAAQCAVIVMAGEAFTARPRIGRGLKRDEIRLNHHRALALCSSMISAQTRSAFVARENRFTFFRIML
ncbi:hypothetical protein CI1B_64210 [Bradyrhizobium ivorense]|uniref:Uncharacterized protein n=1 Tax=Bradyrhizobium ivorense TaxID=2511166 RepID=A0A508TQC3_9BRAD|nr:hypothetical protein [Bradyrhizobium ivorense]VIO76416.1 hypothetical protein CI1B_64210 [Bradyrhizobium ivorense]